MQGITAASNPWFEISPSRCNGIISAELRGLTVDLTWYELLCDFLSQCFSCCSDTPITHAAIKRAVEGLVSAQIKISNVIHNGSGKYSAESVCLDTIKAACEHAITLARVTGGNNRSRDFIIRIKPEAVENFDNAAKVEQKIGIVITTKNFPKKTLFALARGVNKKTGLLRYGMLGFNGNTKRKIFWQADRNKNHCTKIRYNIDWCSPKQRKYFYQHHLFIA